MSNLKQIGIFGGLVAVVLSASYLGAGTTDAEIQKYIEDALTNGCKPVIDICISDCGKNDIKKELKAECVPIKVLQVSGQRANDNYLKLAKKYDIQLKSVDDIKSLPTEIRKKLQANGVVLSPIKEDLSNETSNK